MELLNTEWLIAIGLVLIGLEALLYSFVVLPIGVGFVIVGGIHNYLYTFETAPSQIAVSFLIGITLLLIFRKKLIALVNKESTAVETKIHQGGIGIISQEQIKFSGTYWNTNSDLKNYEQGDKVNILIVDNMAVVRETSE